MNLLIFNALSWEQRKLLECIQKITDFRGRTPKKLGMDWSEEGYLALSALNVKDGYIDFNQDVHYGNQELYDKWMTGNELHKGQVLFTTEAPMGNVAQVPDNRRYILSQRVIALDVKDNLLTENFLATVLRAPTVFAYLIALSSGGTAKGVSQKSLSSVEIRLPKNLKEQEKIADTFSNLDHLITLHQSKAESWKNKKNQLSTISWEQRKLGDVFVEYSEKNHEELPALMIIQGGGTVRRDESDRSLLYDKANLSNYKMVKEGDFIVHLRSFEGGLEKATNTGIISPAYHTFHGENTDSRFYYSYFRSKKFIEIDLKPHVYGIRDGRSIDIEGMKTIKIPSTSYEEQKVIGTFIEQLDNLITLHQRKYEKLQIIKKSMLENCFPKNGEKVPKIRFSGFTGDWEQRKLGDIVEFLDTLRKPLTENKRTKGPYPYYGASGVVDHVADYLFNEELILLSEDGANITDRNYPVCFLASGKYWVNNHAHVIRAKPKMDNNFICMSLERKDYSNYNTGMAMPKLNQDTCRRIPVDCPSYEEQKKIGDYFRSLDNLITLHHRKLNRTQICINRSFLYGSF